MADAGGDPIPTSSVLMAASKHVAAGCRAENLAFINCKKKDPNPEKCLEKGREVTRCVLSLSVGNGGRGGRSDPDVVGADGGVEARSRGVQSGESRLHQLQEEGSQPREVPREGTRGHPIRPVAAKRPPPEVHQRDVNYVARNSRSSKKRVLSQSSRSSYGLLVA